MGDRGWCAYFDAEEAAAIAKYGDPDGGGDAPHCRLCGERMLAHQERCEVVIVTALGDDEVTEHGIAHAACYAEVDWEVVKLA